RRLTWFVSGVMAICLLLSWYPKQDAEVRAQEKSAIVPGKTWAHIEKPESIGYSSERLQALQAWLQSLDTTAMMVSVGQSFCRSYSTPNGAVRCTVRFHCGSLTVMRIS